MSQSVDSCKQKIARLSEKDRSYRVMGRYPNFDEDLTYAALQREQGDAYLALGHALLRNGSLTQERLQELSDAFRNAEGYYNMIEDLFDVGDDKAEALYQQAQLNQIVAKVLGPSRYQTADIFYSNAVRSATTKKPYYQAKWDEARRSREGAGSNIPSSQPPMPNDLEHAHRELDLVMREKEQAIQLQEYELAAELRDREVKLRAHIAKLES